MRHAIKKETGKLVAASKNMDKKIEAHCPKCKRRVYLRSGKKGRCYFAHARLKGKMTPCHEKDKDLLKRLVEDFNERQHGSQNKGQDTNLMYTTAAKNPSILRSKAPEIIDQGEGSPSIYIELLTGNFRSSCSSIDNFDKENNHEDQHL